MPASRWSVVLFASAIPLVAADAAPSPAQTACCLGDYSYAGVMGRDSAAWVGVGGEGLGQ